MITGALVESVGIGLLYPFIQIIENPNYLAEHARVAIIVEFFGARDYGGLIIFSVICLLGFYIFKTTFVLFQNKIQIYFTTNRSKEYASKLYAYYISKPYLCHLDTNVAVITRNLIRGIQNIFFALLTCVLSIFTEVAVIIAIAVMLFMINWLVSLVTIVFFGLLSLVIAFKFKNINLVKGKIKNDRYTDIIKWTNQGFASLKETKISLKERFFTAQFSKAYSEYSNAYGDILFINVIPRAIIEFATICFILLVVLVFFASGEIDKLLPILGVLGLVSMRLMPSVNRITSQYNSFKSQLPILDDMFDELVAVRDFDVSSPTNSEVQKIKFESQIAVQNLSFAYPHTGKKVLDDVSFTIPKGKFVGIIGKSGAGKTTFVDILLGLLAPTEGDVKIDGASVFKNMQGWLANVSYVPQTIYLIDGTIRENIAFGIDESEVSDERIERALKMAELYDFVSELPKCENTFVGDRGVKLSGGQRQRIGIARALYRETDVLVLDEATSALDNETEKNITNTILKLKGKMTIIAIAHRLSTLEQCDFKIKFEKGRVTLD